MPTILKSQRPKRFTLKIGPKRQITLPPDFMSELNLETGDAIEVDVKDNSIKAVRAVTPVPINLFTREMLAKLRKRELESEDVDALPVEDAKQVLSSLQKE